MKRNSPSVQRPCVTIIVPHPDDLEVLTNHFVQYFIAKDFQVYEILFSWGEYGVVNRFDIHEDSLKGKKLRKIRKLENAASKAEYGYFSNGDPHVITIPMGYIDGFVPFSQKSTQRLLKVVEKLNPQIILGPDPFYSIDWHHDHMAVAYNVFFVANWFKKAQWEQDKKKVKYYCYQTYHSNRAIPKFSFEVFKQASLQHRSQMTPLTIRLLGRLLRMIVFPLRRNQSRLREIKSLKDYGTLNAWTSMMHSLMGKIQTDAELYSPGPDQLDLDVDPEYDPLTQIIFPKKRLIK